MARHAALDLALAIALPAGLLAACGDKETTGPGGGDDTADTGDTGGDGGGGSGEVVWEDLRLESNKTFTSCYASGAGLYVTTEDGEVWLRSQGEWTDVGFDTEGNALNSIWGTGQGDAATLVTVGDGGTAALWQAGVWTGTDIGTNNIEAVSGPSLGDLLAVGWGTSFQWNGTAWDGSAIDGNPRFNAVTYGGNVAWAAGEDGVLGRFREGAWETWNHDSRAKLYGIGASGNGVVIAVGEAGTVLSWDGSTWTALESPTSVSLWAVHVDSNGVATVSGNNGEAWRYFDGEWTRLSTGVDNNLYALCVASSGVVWAVGNRGMAIRYRGE